MRHNQNGRRFRGRNNGQGHQNGGGHNNHNGGHGGGGQGRRINPRMQTFDSNGPDVRIRGNAYQINEKYIALARDASSAGDRVLAESYLQHAEYYQRLINEMTEEYNRNNPQPYQQHQQPMTGDEPQPEVAMTGSEGAGNEGEEEGLNDLDQGFLVGNNRRQDRANHNHNRNNGHNNHNNAHANGAPETAEAAEEVVAAEKPARRTSGRVREAETA